VLAEVDEHTQIAAGGLNQSTTSTSSVVSKKTKKTTKIEVEDNATVEPAGAEKEDAAEVNTKPKKSRANSKTKPKQEDVESEEAPLTPKKPAKGKRKAKVEEEVDGDIEEKKTKKKRKTKEDKEEAAVPLASRTDVSTLKRKIFVGAHVSASGGMLNHCRHELYSRFPLGT